MYAPASTPTFAEKPYQRRGTPAVLVAALLLALGVVAGGCQRQDDEPATGPSDRSFDQQEAESVQDSLLEALRPGQIAAAVSGNAFNQNPDAVFSGEPLRGPLAIDSVDVPRDRTVRFALRHSEETPRSRLQIELRYDSVGAAAPDELRPGTYEQQAQDLPTVSAEMHRGRTRYVSRSGQLELRRTEDARASGRFFFEMQRPGADSEDEWFEVTGAFLTATAADTMLSSARQ